MSKAIYPKASPSWQKQVLFTCIICVALLGLVEVGVRIGAYFLFGRSPFFLFYGLKSWSGDDHPEGHSVVRDGYFKFEASRTLHQYGMFKQPTPIQINSAGFRGKDFDPGKPVGGLRVVCLGGSSTFGFYGRDEYTYPAWLERLLRAETRGRPIEVINAGIPHANSDNMIAMLKGELLRYEPDVVTVYEAYNDAAGVMDADALQKLLRWMHAHIAAYVAAKRLIAFAGGPELYSRWSRYQSSDRSYKDYVKRQIELHVTRYESNIREIVALVERKGARVILIKQAVNVDSPATRKGRTYNERVRILQRMVEGGGALLADETMLIIHAALIQSLEKIARERSVTLVDNIAILDEHPEYFASYVHLTEEGNEALARALADVVHRVYGR